MTGIEPELWVDRAAEAVAFYMAAFGVRILHQVGEGDQIVAQLAVGDAAFWVSPGGAQGRGSSRGRSPGHWPDLARGERSERGFVRAVEAGATVASAMADEHGWRLGRLIDPSGHEWEIGKPLVSWPPA